MIRNRWMGLALLACLAGSATAGEWQFGARVGETRLGVDGARLSSGQDVNQTLLSSGLTLGYRWEQGLLVEGGGGGSSDFLPLLGFNKLDHYWLGAGWQFDLGRWRLTPKAGLVVTSLRSTQENIFEGGEPVDNLDDTVPYMELSFGRRLGNHFFLGAYARHNFEDFGDSRMLGLQFGLNFD